MLTEKAYNLIIPYVNTEDCVLAKSTQKNKGANGVALEKLLGIKPGTKQLDFEDGELKTLALEPFNLKKVIPKNNDTMVNIFNKNNYRFIPITYPIKSIQIKISEVNAKKKSWDKWLAFFNKHKDDIKGYINGKLEDD